MKATITERSQSRLVISIPATPEDKARGDDVYTFEFSANSLHAAHLHSLERRINGYDIAVEALKKIQYSQNGPAANAARQALIDMGLV